MLLDEILLSDPLPPSRITSGIPRPLEIICLTCLQKDPLRRYASAGDLADDLIRWRAKLPIKARPASALEKVWRSCRRRPVIASLVGTLALTISVGFIVVFGLWRYADVQRKRAEADYAVARSAPRGC